MPSGKTHDKITLFTLPVIGAIAWGYTSNFVSTLLMSGGYFFSAWMFNGDLDTESQPLHRWGILRYAWIPYQKLIPHRSPLSHGPVVGTVVRLLYVWLFWKLFSYLLAMLGVDTAIILQAFKTIWETGVSWQLWRDDLDKPFLFCLLLGLELGALSHILADHTSTKVKKATAPFRAAFGGTSRKKTRKASK